MFNTLGKPNEYSKSNFGNQDSKMVSYTSGVKGYLGANFNITFTGGKVSVKSQSFLK